METIYHVATRGKLYSIALQRDSFGYVIREFKHGSEQGCACLGNMTLQDSIIEFNGRIDDAAKYDSIFYVRSIS